MSNVMSTAAGVAVGICMMPLLVKSRVLPQRPFEAVEMIPSCSMNIALRKCRGLMIAAR